MKSGKKLALTIAVTCVAVVGAGVTLQHIRTLRHQRARAAAIQWRYNRMHPKKVEVALSRDPDDRVVTRSENPTSLKDEKDLKGRTLWVSAGGQMDYFAYNGRADYAHVQGTLLGAQPIAIKDAVEQAAPKDGTFRIPQGDAHVLLVFTLADRPGKLFAVPVGNREGSDYNLLTDQLFFYDDPHQLYAHWGPQVWKAIDAHQAIAGMNERQVRMALGQVSTPRGGLIGESRVEYDNAGRLELVTFVNGRVTTVKDESR
jgi:hypothetical protein